MKRCSICDNVMEKVFSAEVLRRHNVTYYRCDGCGLLQSQDPYWLDEAYLDPITPADTGLVQRNVAIAARLSALLYFCVDPKGSYLDVAGGYGLLVRLMRDIGFDFYWSDAHCENLLARGFESGTAPPHYAALTAFEVLEHVPDPPAFVSELIRTHGVSTLIFSTQTYSGGVPDKDWWYYAFDTGQHISFYEPRTLAALGRRLGLQYCSSPRMHVLTDRPERFRRIALLTGHLAFPAALYIRSKLGSRTIADRDRLMQAPGEAPHAHRD